MKKVNNQTKENICGTKDRTPGQNLMRAVTGTEQPIGIPEYNYGEMFKILNIALKEDEVEILCKGFGLGCPKKQQKEIAKEYGIKDVSGKFRNYIERLQKSPYKRQLMALVPELSELFDEVAESRNINRKEDEFRELQYRYENAKKMLEQAEEQKKQQEARLAQIEYELESTRRQLRDTETELRNSNDKILELVEVNMASTAKLEATKTAFTKAMQAAEKSFDEALSSDNKVDSACSLESLGLPKETEDKLNRAGIQDVPGLCRCSPHVLARLGVGLNNIDIISKALKERGMSLQA